jgi:hypothetical protein
MFGELKKFKDPVEIEPGNREQMTDYPSIVELAVKQQTIDALVLKRYINEDNSLLKITQMNRFEIYSNYKDEYPLFNLRMKLWLAYM